LSWADKHIPFPSSVRTHERQGLFVRSFFVFRFLVRLFSFAASFEPQAAPPSTTAHRRRARSSSKEFTTPSSSFTSLVQDVLFSSMSKRARAAGDAFIALFLNPLEGLSTHINWCIFLSQADHFISKPHHCPPFHALPPLFRWRTNIETFILLRMLLRSVIANRASGSLLISVLSIGPDMNTSRPTRRSFCLRVFVFCGGFAHLCTIGFAASASATSASRTAINKPVM
jgi:hypothetical protein